MLVDVEAVVEEVVEDVELGALDVMEDADVVVEAVEEVVADVEVAVELALDEPGVVEVCELRVAEVGVVRVDRELPLEEREETLLDDERGGCDWVDKRNPKLETISKTPITIAMAFFDTTA